MLWRSASLGLVVVLLLSLGLNVALADSDGNSVEIMTEWVNTYGFTLDGIYLYDLYQTDEAVAGFRDIANDPGTSWLMPSNRQWGNGDAWELDWKGTSLGGMDHVYADNVDLAAFSGHGLGGNFIMNNYNNDRYASIRDFRLGNQDLEWIIGITCNFLNKSKDYLGGMMYGLHLANGYATDMTITANAGNRFSAWAKAPYGVRVAWYRQGYDTQNSYDRNVARIFGHKNNVNDYLWGYGNAGSDPPTYTATTAVDYRIWDYNLNF